MRNILCIIFALFTVAGYSQSDLQNKLLQNWKLDEITRVDGSTVYDKDITKLQLDLNFNTKENLFIINSSKISQSTYLLTDSLLSFLNLQFKIVTLTDTKLELEHLNGEQNVFALKLIYIPKKLADLTFTPNYYVSNKGDIVYQNTPSKLEPLFAYNNMSPMDYIFEKFEFPPYRKGGFVVRFIVTEKGEVKGARVAASSNDRYNDKLLAAVYDTKNKWVPATYLGEKVAVEMEYDFNLGFDTENQSTNIDSLEYSKTYYGYGEEFFEQKSYKQAETYFKKAIDFNPKNIKAYYQHAACLIFLKRPQEACKDYQTLIYLDQVKAKELFEKYCK